MYQNHGTLYVCGDFNSRMGNASDFIEGVAMIPESEAVDFIQSMHRETFE